MKTLRVYPLIFTFTFITLGLFGQKSVNIQRDGMVVDSEIDDETRDKILEVIDNIVNRYYNIANFWNEDNSSFDEDKYTQFIGLFSGSAQVYDDISQDPSNIEYAVYANNVYQYMQDEGVQFELDNIYINSLDYENGFYLAELDMEKIIYVGLNKDNFPVKFQDGKRYTLNVKIDMPDYDVTEARIQSILGEEKAVRTKKPSILSGNLSAGAGIYTLSGANTVGEQFSFNSNNVLTYGFHLLYRRALNDGEKLWFHIGVGVQNNTLNSAFEYVGSGVTTPSDLLSSPFTEALMNGAIPTAYLEENGEQLMGKLIVDNFDDGAENLNIFMVNVPIGLSFRAMRTFKSRFFIDVTVVPSYGLSSSGKLSGTPDGLFIPDSDYFPSINEILASPNGEDRLNEYRGLYTEASTFSRDVTIENPFTLGVMLSPSYQYDISFNYGVEIGVNLWYNVLSLTNSSNNITEAFLQNDASTSSSILQNYFSNVNPVHGSLKIGFFYKL